jgi:hypothetical protein
MSEALANANPNRAKVDLPLFIYELKDLPELILLARSIWKFSGGRLKDYQRLLRAADTKGASGLYLAYKFGLEPMVRDIVKLFDFATSVADQVKLLDDLVKGLHLNRDLAPSSFSGNWTVGPDLNSNPYVNIAFNYLAKCSNAPPPYDGERRVWYTMDAKLLTELPSSLAEKRELASDIVTGMYLDLDFAWNAIPFTWLIDWFSNFGTIISQTRGTLKCQYQDLNIMVHDTLTAKVEWAKPTGVIGPSSSEMKYHRKRRKCWSVPYNWPTFTLPLLSDSQIGILGALAFSGKGAIRN